jgi:uncharacterized OsmC-like protein
VGKNNVQKDKREATATDGAIAATMAAASPNGVATPEPPAAEPAGPPTFKDRQRALKDAYRADPRLSRQVSSVHSVTPPNAETGKVRIAIDSEAGVVLDVGAHYSVGGIEDVACSGDVFLASLAACYEITLRLIAAASKITINTLDLRVEGDWDAGGTLGLGPDIPVGFTNLRILVDIDAEGPQDRLEKLGELTERYCVISQTIRQPPTLQIRYQGVLAPPDR